MTVRDLNLLSVNKEAKFPVVPNFNNLISSLFTSEPADKDGSVLWETGRWFVLLGVEALMV